MGKIQKIKAERKRAEVERELKKARAKKLFVLWPLLLAVLTGLAGGGFYGYKFAKTKGWIRVAEEKESKKEEKKVERKTYDKVPGMQIDVNKKYLAKFETNKGNFEIELFADKAPKTVNNFVFLAREKFYDDLIFHRIIKDFMIQGGDPKGNGTGDPGYKFEDEINDEKLTRGVLAMANSGPNTNGSQFFVVTAEKTEWLDGKHTAFGKVTAGLDVIMAIQEVQTGENDKPAEDVKINKVLIEEK